MLDVTGYQTIINLMLFYLVDVLKIVVTLLFFKCFYNDSIHLCIRNVVLTVLIPIPFFVIYPFIIPNLYMASLYIWYMMLSYFLISFLYFFKREKGIKYWFDHFLLFCIILLIISTPVNVISDLIQFILIHATPLYDCPVVILELIVIVVFALWLILEFLQRHVYLEMRQQDNILFLLYFVIAMFCDYTNSYTDDYNLSDNVTISIIFKAGFIMMLVLIPVLIIKMRQTAYYNELSTRNEQFLEAELIASNAYKQSQVDTRAFRHDMNNNLLLLSAMMAKQQYSKAEQYIHDLHGKLSAFSPAIVTGEEMLDALLSSKMPLMKQKDIHFSLTGVIDGGLSWKPIDICAVFANLIDNAIEACEKVTDRERYISVVIQKTEFQRIITISNSAAVKVSDALLSSGQSFSSKEDRSRHGFGIKNVRSTLEKNNAMLDIRSTDTDFSAKIILAR